MQYKEIAIHKDGSQDYARLCMYILDVSEEFQKSLMRPMILICPGGGYEMTSDREAEPVAMKFLAMGFHVGVLRYSTAPSRYPTALFEVAEAVKTAKKHAMSWNIDSAKIYVMGFSAGGHLAATYGASWNKCFLTEGLETNPDTLKIAGLILCYPVITAEAQYMHEGSFRSLLGEDYPKRRDELSIERIVDKDFPKTFLWHTFTDDVVPVENSLMLAAALRKAGVNLELHIYPTGGHGLSLADEITSSSDGRMVCKPVQSWISLAETWLKDDLIQ